MMEIPEWLTKCSPCMSIDFGGLHRNLYHICFPVFTFVLFIKNLLGLCMTLLIGPLQR